MSEGDTATARGCDVEEGRPSWHHRFRRDRFESNRTAFLTAAPVHLNMRRRRSKIFLPRFEPVDGSVSNRAKMAPGLTPYKFQGGILKIDFLR